MNVMTSKLAAAGVKVPSVLERCWRVVKDNPGITALRVSEVLNIQQSNVSSILSDGTKRRMFYTKDEVRKVKGPRGTFAERKVLTYYTSLAEYARLPMPAGTVSPAPAVKPEPEAPHAPSVDHLTIAQARALYDVLHKMFGDKK